MLLFRGGYRMIKIVLCDDNEAYLEVLEHKLQLVLEEMHAVYTIQTATSCEALHSLLCAAPVDLVFLDIMIHGQNTTEWAGAHISPTQTQIIFMTSFAEEAYEISEVPHTYFLLKSKLTDCRLKSAVQKAIWNIQKTPDVTTVKSGNERYTISYRDLIFIESTNNNIHLHFSDGHQLTLYSSLKSFAEKLPNHFLRCHKSFIINMNHIVTIRPHEFILNGGISIPIPPKKYKEMLFAYQAYLNDANAVGRM